MVMLISPAASSNFTTCFVTCPRRGGDWGATKRASAFVHLFAASNPSSNTFNFQNHPQNDDLLTYCFLGCFVRFKSIQNAPPPPPFPTAVGTPRPVHWSQSLESLHPIHPESCLAPGGDATWRSPSRGTSPDPCSGRGQSSLGSVPRRVEK